MTIFIILTISGPYHTLFGYYTVEGFTTKFNTRPPEAAAAVVRVVTTYHMKMCAHVEIGMGLCVTDMECDLL